MQEGISFFKPIKLANGRNLRQHLRLVKCNSTSPFMQVNEGVNRVRLWGQFGSVPNPPWAYYF